MANTVRVVDAIAFFVARAQKYTEQAAWSRQKWEAAKVEYEKGLWFRIFGTAFSETGKGSVYRGMFTEQWSFIRFERWTEEANAILCELGYHHRMGDERMEWREEWEDDGWHISMFYVWCQKQGRPL